MEKSRHRCSAVSPASPRLSSFQHTSRSIVLSSAADADDDDDDDDVAENSDALSPSSRSKRSPHVVHCCNAMKSNIL